MMRVNYVDFTKHFVYTWFLVRQFDEE